MQKPDCAIDAGTCEPAPPGSAQKESAQPALGTELIYIGDPMCSWCWGVAPALRQLQHYCQRQSLPFRVLVGGLRPGGGDPWNEEFRQFLAHHWGEVSKRTGQTFRYDILQREFFDYDTEPACRSVVAARLLDPGTELDFFAAVQHGFYVANEDPKQREFYRRICGDLKMDFDEFVRLFDSDDVKTRTRGEFQQSSRWGVSGFPTVLLHTDGRLSPIASGYSTFELMREKLDGIRGCSGS